jgi:hypothetical protein
LGRAFDKALTLHAREALSLKIRKDCAIRAF